MNRRMKRDVLLTLARLKSLVQDDRFQLVHRRDPLAAPVTTTLAKQIVRQLQPSDFVKTEPNRNNPRQAVWIFKTGSGNSYYLKFVFTRHGQWIVFISFHLDR